MFVATVRTNSLTLVKKTSLYLSVKLEVAAGSLSLESLASFGCVGPNRVKLS